MVFALDALDNGRDALAAADAKRDKRGADARPHGSPAVTRNSISRDRRSLTRGLTPFILPIRSQGRSDRW
jgi:hypothetical protein